MLYYVIGEVFNVCTHLKLISTNAFSFRIFRFLLTEDRRVAQRNKVSCGTNKIVTNNTTQHEHLQSDKVSAILFVTFTYNVHKYTNK